jgi:hypothetical protein
MIPTVTPSQAPHSPRRISPQPQGFVLVVAIVLLAALMGMALVAVQHSRNATSQTRRSFHQTRVFYAAEGGSAQAAAWLGTLLALHPIPTSEQLAAVPRPTMPGFTFPEFRIISQPVQTGREVATGPFGGLKADIKPFEIVSHARNSSKSVDQIVHQTVNQNLIGMYQFGIFYDKDLEMNPDFPLDYYNGRIHSNGDIHFCSHNTLDISATVTAAGHIYNTPLDPTLVTNGKARFKDPADQWHDLSYDWRDPNWVSKSLADWGGRVMDSSHGIPELAYPVPAPLVSIDIIKRGLVGDNAELKEKRYYYKAGLRILDGVGSDSSGNAVALPAGLISAVANVKDWREGCLMAMYTLDISVLRTSGVLPANHVVYISYSGAHTAVRIKNGSQLPGGGLVIATDNPLYLQGDYNKMNKQPSSLMCDAFNVYSNNWSDGNSTCVIAGNSATVGGHYGGGAENLIRLNEKWVGHELTYRGSLICIYVSERAVGPFSNASYVEAQRDWGFDPDLLDPNFWPDDNMLLRTVSRGEWRSE